VTPTTESDAIGEERPEGPPPEGLTAEDAPRVAAAERLAASLLDAARAQLTPAERRQRRRIDALVADEASRVFMLELTDQVLRIATARRAAARLAELVAATPRPAMAGLPDRIALRAAAALAPLAPVPVVALTTARLRRELSALVLPAAARPLGRHLRRRREQGMRLNLNPLGEAVLGERQARDRARLVTELLGRADVHCVSVKLSSLYSQLDVLAYDQSLDEVRTRLRPILAAATAAEPPKLVNLDMEEYRDLHLTVDAFMSVLSEDAFATTCAGVALQAYLPDSVEVLERLCGFARARHAWTGTSVRVRLVKGANLAMERVEAELRGWPQAPFETKEAVDANYKRLLDIALRPENVGALRVGVASHNLFDVAWALTLDAAAGGGRVEIEMLEGMAPAEARAVAAVAGGVLLYAPVVRRHDFESAVAYLVRRFDENTAPENFLAHLGSLAPGSPAWEEQRRRFRRAVRDRHLPAPPPRRTATLGGGGAVGDDAHRPRAVFANAPDTDFALAGNRTALLDAMSALAGEHAPVHALVGGEEVAGPLTGAGVDPSAPGATFYRYVECDLETVERAVQIAAEAAPRWASTPPEERRRLLHAAADRMEVERARTIAVMARDGGKVAREADSEVSEAVDGARYYGDQALELTGRAGGARFSPYGVVAVVPPWNFPYAIPAGGVFAALAAANAVILKPAPETVLTASLIVAQCHAAGVPPDVLQFLPCADAEPGQRLVTDPRVGCVVLTGAFETARLFLGWRPGLALHAETSGKNAIVVSAATDQEDAVRDIVHSAFSHAGQKCSAASLAILEAPVYDDRRFLDRLADAVSSLRVGPATDLSARVGPLIRPPEGPLLRQLTTLGPGERWLVEPRNLGGNPHLWSPGVKLGVAPSSELHLTECFGPVLGLMRAADLDEAVALENTTPYGLTGGIASLDDREIDAWMERVAVGNAYVNRHITGAIVRRQPFGGWKRSAVGPGAKAGGPHYVASLGRWQGGESPDVEAERAAAGLAAKQLLAGVDVSGLTAETDVFRLRPLAGAVLRLGNAPDPHALAVSLAVADELGVPVEVSAADDAGGRGAAAAGVVVEDDDQFVARLRGRHPDRVRLAGCPPSLRLALLDEGFAVDVEPLVASGPYELLRWTREQAVSTTRHRHGNVLGRRAAGPPSSRRS
jgi:RHH-type proline utilization regulon transcriptional repressor/proline dehydrogenase/delta 1-pyrroline-5-carboxylate dehydrogenase